MNDWLDYKGSGSARAYADNGLMGDSYILHGLFGIQTKKDKEAAKAKQDEAQKRYNAAVMERFYQLKRTADKAKIDYENIVANYRNLTVDQQRASESMFKKKIEDYKKAWVKATNELDHYAESELDKARKHGYVNDKLMDEFIGAGWRETVRNAINSVISHSLRDKIDYGVEVVMDTLTGADRKREAKQKEASKRLRQAQIESESKKLNEGATKLLKDAADLRKDAYEYHDKVNTSEKLTKQKNSVKDPRALAQITSAESNLDNDLRRMYVRINAKITTLREDYNKLNDAYNQYTLDSYPANYVKGVPDKLRMADKFIKESAVPRNIDW